MSTLRRKARHGENAYSVASKLGFPFIRGNGKSWQGVYLVRFTRDSAGEGPALFVGQDGAHWVLQMDAELPTEAVRTQG